MPPLQLWAASLAPRTFTAAATLSTCSDSHKGVSGSRCSHSLTYRHTILCQLPQSTHPTDTRVHGSHGHLVWCRQCIHGLFPSKSEALHNRSVRRELLGMTYRVLTDLLNITYNRDTIIVIDDDGLCIYIPQQANSNVLRRGGCSAPVGSKYIRHNIVGLRSNRWVTVWSIAGVPVCVIIHGRCP